MAPSSAGAEALARSPHRVPLAPLVEEWLEVMKREVTPDWLRDLRHRVRGFLKLHPGLTTDRFTRGLVRKWVDDMPQASQTRANYRGAVRRFGAWLVERGYLEENPAAELRINTAKERNAKPPAVLSVAQARGLAWAVTTGPARPLMGWVALSLLCGLRPQMEAAHLGWSEIDFKRGVVLAMGRKRGARAREVPMSKAAREWLRSVKDAGEEKPAMFNRYWLRVAVRQTNAWIKKHQPKAAPLKWSGDILRHTYASAQAASGVGMPVLAAQMGNSTEVIHAFYRAPMLKSHAAEIMALPVG